MQNQENTGFIMMFFFKCTSIFPEKVSMLHIKNLIY